MDDAGDFECLWSAGEVGGWRPGSAAGEQRCEAQCDETNREGRDRPELCLLESKAVHGMNLRCAAHPLASECTVADFGRMSVGCHWAVKLMDTGVAAA